MGDQADNKLNPLNLTTTQLKSYYTVKTQFDKHFVVHQNIIFEQVKFNQHRQEEGNTGDTLPSCKQWPNMELTEH